MVRQVRPRALKLSPPRMHLGDYQDVDVVGYEEIEVGRDVEHVGDVEHVARFGGY